MVNNNKHFIKNLKCLVNEHLARHSNINSACLHQMKKWHLVMAQENFMRREPVEDIWVVNRVNIRGLDQEEKQILNRTR